MVFIMGTPIVYLIRLPVVPHGPRAETRGGVQYAGPSTLPGPIRARPKRSHLGWSSLPRLWGSKLVWTNFCCALCPPNSATVAEP